jgi:selenide,water dikinase
MGGTPVTALAIAGFPDGVLDLATIRQIFLGGYDKLRDARVALLGGHTVRDPEVKFGYAVTGAIDPSRVLTNAGARAGDVLVLTKALGTGIAGTAIKFNRAPLALVEGATASMTLLNAGAAQVLARFGGSVHACTDVTGFGLIGHATEMAVASNVTLEIEGSRLPLLPGVRVLASANRSGGLASNREYFEMTTEVAPGVDPALADLAYDPQTSGGLLAAVDAAVVDEVCRALSAGAPITVRPIGRVRGTDAARVRLIP